MIELWVKHNEQAIFHLTTSWFFILATLGISFVVTYVSAFISAFIKDWRKDTADRIRRKREFGSSLPRMDNPPPPPAH
jgi:hypothetical protein